LFHFENGKYRSKKIIERKIETSSKNESMFPIGFLFLVSHFYFNNVEVVAFEFKPTANKSHDSTDVGTTSDH
jgi:hypothetical protein